MARQLRMAKQTTTRTLHESGHSNREIARLTGVHRETVGKYVSRESADNGSKPAKPRTREKGTQLTTELLGFTDGNASTASGSSFDGPS